jgi:hypothetical protein
MADGRDTAVRCSTVGGMGEGEGIRGIGCGFETAVVLMNKFELKIYWLAK